MPATTPPRAHLVQDPRFKECLTRSLKKHGLEDYFSYAVIKLVTGETDPRNVTCCNSGCHPCAKDYLGAAQDTLDGLANGRKKRFWIF